ncbi:ribonuclease III [Thermosulfuriphilus sp.]
MFKQVACLEEKLTYRFRDPALLLAALIHRSYQGDRPEGLPYRDNEILEFLGDAVLDLIISQLLVARYGDRYREGDLSRMRAYLVNEERLARVAEKLGLGDCLLIGRGEELTGGRKKPSILAGAFEAVVGAIFLDGGYEVAYSFVRRLFSQLVGQAARLGLRADYKSLLQELTQALERATPVYELEGSRGPDHAKVFTVAVKLKGRPLARGRGRSKKEAEQEAAKRALQRLKNPS